MASLGGVTIPDDLLWTDEFSTTLIAQRVEVTLGGALLIDESEQLAGRLITLEGGRDAGWATRTQVLALRALAEQVGVTHTLVLADAREFSVMFRRPPLVAEPVIPYSVAAAGDPYTLRINLIEV